MEKILLAIDAVEPSGHAMEFALYLGKLTHAKICGVFLENLSAATSNDEIYRKKGSVTKNVLVFRDACGKESIKCMVNRESGNPLESIKRQSRYADLIVLDAGMSFSSIRSKTPSAFVSSVLNESECPVVVASLECKDIEEIILTCNETRSSVFAIRQFRYLFPQFCGKKITVLEVERAEEPDGSVNENFRQWVGSHYPAADFVRLKGDIRTVLQEYLSKKRNALIVAGTSSRNPLSQVFAPSLTETLIGKIQQAFFIAHN